MIVKNSALWLLAILSTFAVSACQQTLKKELNDTDNYTQVDEATISTVIGRKLVFLKGNSQSQNYITVRSDNTFDGTWGGAPIAGTWEMRDGAWCRVLTEFFEPEKTGIEDCQLWEIDENRLRGTRNRGAGVSADYILVGSPVATAPCAANPETVNSTYGSFRYQDVAGSDFFWVGDDDKNGLNPVRLKLYEDCVLRAAPGYEDFGGNPQVVAQWQYTPEGAIRIIDWNDEFSLIRTTDEAHEICWASFSTCEGEGQFRSEGGVRRLFLKEADARAYFASL